MSSLEARRSRTPKRSTQPRGRLSWPQADTAVVECVVLAVACLITYWLVTSALSRVYSVSRDDDLLGGMWAVIATIFRPFGIREELPERTLAPPPRKRRGPRWDGASRSRCVTLDYERMRGVLPQNTLF